MRRIAVIPGDGVGSEVIGHGLRVLEAASAVDPGFVDETVEFPWGSEHYLLTGSMMDPDALERLAAFDAIYFGAVGSRSVPDHVTLWGLRLKIVQGFDQAISLRPARLLPGIRGPLANRLADEIDFVVVRENTEGEYAGVGGFSHRGQPTELALQTSVYTRGAIERTARYAFELAELVPPPGLRVSRSRTQACTRAFSGTESWPRWRRAIRASRSSRYLSMRRPRDLCSIRRRST